jgi:hypothetical protein
MRGAFADQGGLFSYIAPEARVPANHPLRKGQDDLAGHCLKGFDNARYIGCWTGEPMVTVGGCPSERSTEDKAGRAALPCRRRPSGDNST